MENVVIKNPIKIFNCCSVKAAIWSDSRIINGSMVELHSIKIDKSYKDCEEWKHTNTFNAEDLPKVAIVVMEAYKFIRVRSSDPNECDKET